MNTRIWALVGPSGVGKSTLANRVLTQCEQENLALEHAVSFTTRTPREEETHGKDYYFISTSEFERLLVNGELAEHIQVESSTGINHYGLTKQEFDGRLSRNQNVLVIVEPYGIAQLKALYPGRVTTVYLDSPYPGAEQDRMLARGESVASIQARYSMDARIRLYKNQADVVLVSGDLDQLVASFLYLLKTANPQYA